MNWMLIVVILVVAANMVWGYKQGFLRTFYRMFQWILILVFMTWATPHVSDYLINHTQLAETVQQQSEERIRQIFSQDVEEGETSTQGAEEDNEMANNYGEQGKLSLKEEKLLNVFPAAMLDKVLDKSGAYESAAAQITHLIINGISYLLVMIFAFLLLRIIDYVLRIIEKIPLLEGANQFFGVVLGGVKAVPFIWIFMAIAACFAGTALGMSIISYISESPLLSWMYENNYLLKIIFSFV